MSFNSRGPMRALQVIFGAGEALLLNLARGDHPLADLRGGSPFFSPVISRNFTAGTSMCRSMRSSSGPEMRPR
jgi:hypothetical protein